MVAYERSLFVNRGQTETYSSLGFLMLTIGGLETAARYLRCALLSANEYTLLEPLSLRELLSMVILGLMSIHSESNRKIPLFPTDKECRDYFREISK